MSAPLDLVSLRKQLKLSVETERGSGYIDPHHYANVQDSLATFLGIAVDYKNCVLAGQSTNNIPEPQPMLVDLVGALNDPAEYRAGDNVFRKRLLFFGLRKVAEMTGLEFPET